MSYSLCLTLGHNSSAILIKEGEILIGYENERLTGIKADSQFPIHAIEEISKHYDLNWVTDTYISHWSTFKEIEEMSLKHWRKDLLLDHCPNTFIISNTDHHDAHVNILRVFTSEPFEWEIVADGFGNYNEVISIYHNQKLIHRAFGFDKSLGLLYQYTTAYLDLKMNQDEFKLLGYEAHIKKIVDDDLLKSIHKNVKIQSKKYLKAILESSLNPKYDLVVGLEALPNIRLKIHNYNDYLLYERLKLKKKDLRDFAKKVIVAYFVQCMVEDIMVNIVNHYQMKEVALTGGLFMNVKLNNTIAKEVNKISILPICGDQSCGLGVYQEYNKDLVWPEHLFWGKRSLRDFPLDTPKTFITISLDNAIAFMISQLHFNKIVNFVYDGMEFGARALGHTSTFALPTEENVEYINMLNSRNTVMPMAPFISQDQMFWYNNDDKVHKSLEYMIMTLNLSMRPDKDMMGIVHNHPINGTLTSRIQLINYDHFLYPVLEQFGILINTSFNKHGVPIVYNIEQILKTHNYQVERDHADRIVTVICK